MPKRLEEALKRSAEQHGFKKGSERYRRYVYGALERYKAARQGSEPEKGKNESVD